MIKKIAFCILAILSLSLSNCKSPEMNESQMVSIKIDIDASASSVWGIITSKEYAKELGAIFDKHAFVESDWQLGSDVHFKYEPDKTVSTGTITNLVINELIQVNYNFSGFKYQERYTVEASGDGAKLGIYAGPYTEDLDAQKVVWGNWLAKVKEMVEK